MADREKRGYVETPDGLIHYREQGTGPVILLLHQTPSNSEQYSASLPLFAARGFRTIAMDTPGFGMSDGPAEKPDHMRWFAGRVKQLLDGLGVDKAHIFGHHTGCTIALETAAQYPERVGKLAFFGFLALKDDERDYWIENFMPRWEADAEFKFIETWIIPKCQSFLPDADGPQTLREVAATCQAGPRYWWTYWNVFTHDSYRAISEVKAPTLLFAALGDREILNERMKSSQAAFADARWAEIPGHPAKHMREPAEYVKVAADFFAE
jgi:pimeloyl-ACP methyl ester carboxylesterase